MAYTLQYYMFCLFFFYLVQSKSKIVSMQFIRKYIHVAKLIKPVLTHEAAEHISQEYAKLRSHDEMNNDRARVCMFVITCVLLKHRVTSEKTGSLAAMLCSFLRYYGICRILQDFGLVSD